MKEVTMQEPYNQYPGRSFICTLDEAKKYVDNNCKKAHHIDEINKAFTNQIENIVWWESRHNWNEVPTRKIAHYNATKELLVVFLYAQT